MYVPINSQVVFEHIQLTICKSLYNVCTYSLWLWIQVAHRPSKQVFLLCKVLKKMSTKISAGVDDRPCFSPCSLYPQAKLTGKQLVWVGP